MRKKIVNEKGITLIELLAVLAIGSIFMLMAVSIYVLVQSQYSDQSDHANDLTDLTYAIRVITKEVRQNPDQVDVEETDVTIGDNNMYTYEEKSIYKNGSPFVINIDCLYVEKKNDKLKIKIKSSSDIKVKTKLVLRGGGEGEDKKFIQGEECS